MMNEQRTSGRDVWLGVGLTLLLHLIQIPMGLFTSFFPVFFIGASQFLYMIPAIIIAQRKGRLGIVKGLIIGASITFLLNAACAGIIFINLLR